ncbi:hypothetical protein NK214_05615 [Chromobacterium sp. S0633]|uniref:TniQ family protein n=1 Tax=Chromobacterium sp. S0633 TaxID=2957805 RepID=UPI0020A1A0FA|nr:TniQ family protein [Chromobacterium sp. S0633]MCP1289664.1 hypothetical protein [Chromobacterium sp. S0633]
MVMVVEPLPDELGKAHAGRIAYLNALPRLEKLLHHTLGPAKDHLKRDEFRQQFHYLATQLAMKPEQYLAQHSMLPFLYAYVGRRNTGQTYIPLIRQWLKQADSPILQYVRSCPHCIEKQEADIAKLVGTEAPDSWPRRLPATQGSTHPSSTPKYLLVHPRRLPS